MTRLGTVAGIALLGTSFLASEAFAGWRHPAPEGEWVTAESRYGNGTISGPVRATSTGYEVRLPKGTWVGCRRSCSETLRVETIDFFETDGRMTGYGTLTNECGIFGCLDWSRGW